MIIRDYVAKGLRLERALVIVCLSRSTYYYKPNGGKHGKKASTHTLFKGKLVANSEVVEQIKKILKVEFIDYGYKRTTEQLKNMGYKIGKKKVYRLMKEQRLLQERKKSKHKGKKYIVYKSPQPTGPLKIIEIDFKYVWIEGSRRFAYLVCMLDTFHRQIYEWSLNFDMKTNRLTDLIRKFVEQCLVTKNLDPKTTKILFQTDNGSQFTAKNYKKTLEDIGIERSYIPCGVPQLNGHIEGFHSTIERLVCSKYKFISLQHARKVFERFFNTYNNERIMKSILHKSPTKFIELWDLNKIELKKVKKKNKFYLKEESLKS